ncbi:MAG: RNA polymerase sigma factor [Chloroflexota bacterium]|nr:RNA polymerase sigma factor [Chloroflexota bacterium]
MAELLPLQSANDSVLAALVTQARAGDTEAFNTLFQSYTGRICTYLARMVGNDEEGRDLAQETFLKAWQGLPGMRNSESFMAWLYRIATNIAIDYTRKQRVKRPPQQYGDWDSGQGEPPAPEAGRQVQGLEESVAETEQIRQTLTHVAPKYRACLLLQIEAGFSQREIAELLHISEKSVSVYVQRGCEQFRQEYQYLDQGHRSQVPQERTDK